MDKKEERVIELAKKLKALADKGVGGEKENAISMLKRYMRKHNLSIKDIEDDHKKPVTFIFKNRQKLLLRQIIYVVMGKDVDIYRYKTGKRNAYIVHCTNVERINIEAMFDFYWKAFEKEYEIFEIAFINKNKLFPADDEPRLLSELSPEEAEKARRMFAMAGAIQGSEFRKQISN